VARVAPVEGLAEGRATSYEQGERIMSKAQRIRNVGLGCIVTAGLVMTPIVATGGLSSAAGASGSTAVVANQGIVAAQSAGNAATASLAPGTYLMNVSLNTIPAVTYGGQMTVSSGGSFTWKLNNLSCAGIWTSTGNYIGLEVTGSTATGCITGADWELTGHLTRKGVRAGTTMLWRTDASGDPTSFLANGTWTATRG
jgi:hypothetical protein